MATRKNASKQTTHAKLNINIDDKTLSKASKQTKNVTKRLNKNLLTSIILFLLIGILLGVGSSYFVMRSDCFEIIGSEELSLTIGESYFDEGCKIISLGRDISSNVIIETDLIKNPDGSFTGNDTKTYYILYKSNDIKYGKIFTVTKIRLITFVEPIDEDEINASQSLKSELNSTLFNSNIKGEIYGF